jgi:AAA15 family ATPase/GTPase
MFRALSLLIQLNYTLMIRLPVCVLIDDIGEGLDFYRARALINLLIKKVENTPVQLIMTTNDRFVMNGVPLKYWSIIERSGGKCKVYNYKNSRTSFDEFDFTGLSNFDFFTSKSFLQSDYI